MQRIITTRSDNLSELQIARDVMVSAYGNDKEIVVVAVNYTEASKEVKLVIPDVKKIKEIRQFVTSESPNDNMKFYPLNSIENVVLRPRSIATIVLKK